jgi:hypothetical protein
MDYPPSAIFNSVEFDIFTSPHHAGFFIFKGKDMDKQQVIEGAFLEGVRGMEKAIEDCDCKAQIKSPWFSKHTEELQFVMSEWLIEEGGMALLAAAMKNDAPPSAFQEFKDRFKIWYKTRLSKAVDEEHEGWIDEPEDWSNATERYAA